MIKFNNRTVKAQVADTGPFMGITLCQSPVPNCLRKIHKILVKERKYFKNYRLNKNIICIEGGSRFYMFCFPL